MISLTPMPVTSEFQDGTFVVTVLGDFASGELRAAIVAGYSDPRFTRETPVLLDTRRSLAIPSSADVMHSSQVILGRRPAGHIGRFAIITRNDPLRFGLARMASLTMENMGATMAVFHEAGAALNFLRSTTS